tara:strand:- start:162 stop:365 length:204 start_codon:yes stop_codon:yes gene_type:complete
MLKIIKLVWNYFKEANEIETELNKQGIWNFHTVHGTFTYTNPKLNTYINTVDDRSNSIPKNAGNIKE